MARKVEFETVEQPRATMTAAVSSKGRGRPIADVVQQWERTDPGIVSEKGISSAALRAGDLVRSMRKAAGLSQSELAERIGVKQSRISEIESGVGTQGPTWEVMERIAAAFGQNLGIAAGPGNPYGIPFQNINTVDPGMTVEPGMWELAAGAQSTSGQHPKRGQQQRRLSEQDVSEVVRQLAPLLPQILMQIVRGPPGAFGAFGHGYGHPFGYGYGPAGFGQPLYPLAGLAGLETLCGLSGWPHQAGLGGSQNWGAQFRRQLTPQDAHEIVSQLTAVISNLQRRT